MHNVVTAAQMAETDKYTIDKIKIPGVVLMENAGLRVFQYIYRAFQHNVRDKSIVVLCGPGNNGGDGYVIARHLFNHGARVHVFRTGNKVGGDALINYEALEQSGCHVSFIEKVPGNELHPDMIIDAMLGTGVKGPLRAIFAQLADWTNEQKCPVVAVDIPTGVNADTGAVEGPAVQADVTVTFAMPKRGLLFWPGRRFVGDLIIADISIPGKSIAENDSLVYLPEEIDIKNMLPVRHNDAYKNSCGMTAVVAGSHGFTGAACLTSQAVMYAGTGLCYLAAPASLSPIYETKMTEVVVWPLAGQEPGRLDLEHFDFIAQKAEKMSSIAIGPGLGTATGTSDLVHKLLKTQTLPMVLDADGLNVCAGHTSLFTEYTGELVITPHPGEFSRLTGASTKEIADNRIEMVRSFSEKWNIVVVLKGAPTIVGIPGGRVYINSTGNAGMATAGSGDVLTGLVAGLLAQGLTAGQAAVAGVYTHGLAGDLAKQEYGKAGMTAGHLLEKIPASLQKIMKENA